MPTKKTKQETSSTDQFMLEEYKMLRERFFNMRNEGVSRINLLFTVTSAVLGGILLFDSNNSSLSPEIFRLVLLILLFILAIVGYDVYLFMIARDRVSDRVERGMARVRHYFVEKNDDLETYLVYTTLDGPTTYLSRPSSGLRRTVQIIEAFIIALTTCVVATFALTPFEFTIVIGSAVFIITFLLLQWNSRRLLKQELKLADKYIKFAKNK